MALTTLISTILILALTTTGSANGLARPVQQHKRDTYIGGWPLGAVTCPSDAPVVCLTSDQPEVRPNFFNQECCPSGTQCITDGFYVYPHCCTPGVECLGQISNLPLCADPNWQMYQLSSDNSVYFCCEPGQVGVNPVTGYTGLCKANDGSVPAAQFATLVSQVGGGAPSGASPSAVSPTAASPSAGGASSNTASIASTGGATTAPVASASPSTGSSAASVSSKPVGPVSPKSSAASQPTPSRTGGSVPGQTSSPPAPTVITTGSGLSMNTSHIYAVLFATLGLGFLIAVGIY